ncbi:MAG TPA: hypothetical protein VFN42_07570, partial [Acetobacteraceae bacterium]|nr:hypothetical protein [Acetobacteraceae bacterium]
MLITGTVSGTAVLPVPYNIVVDDATTPVTVVANGTSPQVASVTRIGQLYGAQGGAGYFISGNFSAQGSASMGTGGGSGGGNLWVLGAVGNGNSFLASDSRADSIVAAQGANWIATGLNSSDRIWINGGTAVIASRGADTIAIGAAEATVVGSGEALVFAGSGKAVVAAIAGTDSVIGSTAAVTVTGSDSASLLAYGGSAGGNVMLN